MLKLPFAERLDSLIEKGLEQAYLQELAKKYVAGKPQSYLYVRSIVMDIHIEFDYALSVIVTYPCWFGVKKVGLSYTEKEVFKIIDKSLRVEYSKRLDIVKELKIFSQRAIKILYEVNKLRNAFAHGCDKIESHEYIYYGKPIFERTSITELMDDQQIVNGEAKDFLIKLSA